jgi:hypothetical protein
VAQAGKEQERFSGMIFLGASARWLRLKDNGLQRQEGRKTGKNVFFLIASAEKLPGVTSRIVCNTTGEFF